MTGAATAYDTPDDGPQWTHGEPPDPEPLPDFNYHHDHAKPKLGPTPAEMRLRRRLLRGSPLLTWCCDHSLDRLAADMTNVEYQTNDRIVSQDCPQHDMLFLRSGVVQQNMKMHDGRVKVLNNEDSQKFFNNFFAMRGEPARATLVCLKGPCRFAVLPGSTFSELVRTDGNFAEETLYSVSRYLRRTDEGFVTPFLEQESVKPQWIPVTLAASIESFYRSALQSFLNFRLTGTKSAMFPQMHVQIPTRIVYINGFKILRHYIDTNCDAEQYAPNQNLARLGFAVAPGVIMTPMSSVLEACNAHLNPEPLWRRLFRGYVPRCLREVIFGIGLNQMSDFFEERVPKEVTSEALRTAMGSVFAGVVSGYLSHVPHNLSTMKLMTPSKSYGRIFREFAQKSADRLPPTFPARARVGAVLAVVAPVGVHVRTAQVVGSFVILNGFIEGWKKYFETDTATA
eukprot:m.113644 g.113644  ORF g.113644 m.113644 type:complete len:455 (-) comp16254_c5_seq1:170-1534(-)